MRKLVQLALRGYKHWLSPMLPVACRYVPTCSEYAEEALERYGVLRGGAMAIRRLLRCNPFGGSGFDPVVKIAKCDVEREMACAHCEHVGSEISRRQPMAQGR
jgi:putative membrane protein insertion efficiency factor